MYVYMMLALLSDDSIPTAFEMLCGMSKSCVPPGYILRFNKFIKYMANTWIGCWENGICVRAPMYPIVEWSVYKLQFRTNK